MLTRMQQRGAKSQIVHTKSNILHRRRVSVVLVLDHVQPRSPQVLDAVVHTDIETPIADALLLTQSRLVLGILALRSSLSL